MKFYAFHLMPYADLDLNYTDKYKSSWVVLPNTYYDPKKGHDLYNRYLDELEYAEELGFDGLCVNEHHQNAYGLMPSPIVMASALARRTKRAKLAILGNAFGIREHPLTLAEEHAMIDVITKGRVITGMVRGIGCEYFSMGANPADSHERFHEAHDLVVQAWTRPGPFAFEGKHYHFEYVNVWPRPYQQPHPPIWVPSLGSSETIEWAAHPDRKYVYLQSYSPIENVVRFLDQYREIAQRHGYTAMPDQLGWLTPIYVGETDEKAVDEARPHIEAFFNKFLKFTAEMLLPPGYTTRESYPKVAASRSSIAGPHSIEGLMGRNVLIIGGPDTVRKKLADFGARAGFGHFLGAFQFGTLPHDLTMRSMERFAREVMPALRVTKQPARVAAE